MGPADHNNPFRRPDRGRCTTGIALLADRRHDDEAVRRAAVTSLDGLPLMLTVAEAAQVLRISRTTAYKLAEDWRATNGRSGLPTVKLRGRLFVRRVDLAVMVGVATA